ncbi:MAG: hypothetical protein PHC51_13375 [bacterium]|nr:hypothetical protein [bacterium]
MNKPIISRKVILTACLFFNFCGLSACREELVHGLNEIQSIELQRALADQGLVSKSIFDGKSWDLTVAAEDIEVARASLVRHRNLLKPEIQVESKAPSLFSSRDERIWYHTEQSGRAIAASLHILPGVIDARVHLSRPPGSFWEKETRIESASVLLLVKEAIGLDEEAVRMLVAKGSGCDVGNIAVVIQEEKEPSTLLTRESGKRNVKASTGYLSAARKSSGLLNIGAGRFRSVFYPLVILVVMFVLALKHRRNRIFRSSRADGKLNPQSLFIK